MTLVRKIAVLPGASITSKTALISALENADDIEAVVMVVRRDDRWEVTWGGDITNASLCMASVTLPAQAQREINDDGTFV